MIELFNSKIVIGNDALQSLNRLLFEQFSEHFKFIIADTNTKKKCLGILQKHCIELSGAPVIVIKPGEQFKSLETVSGIWKMLIDESAGRKTLLINLGGGVITDLGAFAAATYMRGIPFINVPTTLLAMVDAAIGGKTGINFLGLKNNIGSFTLPAATFIYKPFLKSLPIDEINNGYAEIIKCALIEDKLLFETLNNFEPVEIPGYDEIEKTIAIKCRLVEQDLHDSGLRKKLNFGHTVGHAIEEFFMKGNIVFPHGHAVAIGMAVETILSNKKGMLKRTECTEILDFLFSWFEMIQFNADEVQSIVWLMKFDKKNDNEKTNFTLLKSAGISKVDNYLIDEEVINAFNYYRKYAKSYYPN